MLIDADIAVMNEDLVGKRQRRQHAGTVHAIGARLCIIGCARQHDRGVLRALWHDDDGVELCPVAHRDHLDALVVVGVLVRNRELIGSSEEHTSELQSLMRSSYADFCLKKKINTITKLNIDRKHLPT